MRDWQRESEKRVKFIKDLITTSKAKGIVFGNSGGKDSALVGILSSMACDNVTGVIMPCQSKRNLTSDKDDAELLANQFKIKTKIVDLTDIKGAFSSLLSREVELSKMAECNINPRLRMITLYSIAQSTGCLVAGTGNRSEIYMGYFTKWGDGASDFNPIADLTATEIFAFLKFLKCPNSIVEKAPSAALYEGQTDEQELGVTYKSIDNYILNGCCNDDDLKIIQSKHNSTEHKRVMPKLYKD